METTLSKKQVGKYIEVTYNANLDKLSSKLKYNATQPCISDEEAENFISKVKAIESIIEKDLSARKLSYKTPLIILTYLPMIESVASGLDIRSNRSNEDIAAMLVLGYDRIYNDAVLFCNQMINMYEEVGKTESYGKNYKNYDKHNELVEEFQLDLRTFKMDDFKTSFKSMNLQLDEILALLKEENKK